MRRLALAMGLTVLAGCGLVTDPDLVATPALPVKLFQSVSPSIHSTVAMSPGGRTVVALRLGNWIGASDSVDGTRWASVVRLPAVSGLPDSVFDLTVELDDHGNGFAAWVESRQGAGRTIVTCRYQAAGGWSAPRIIARTPWPGAFTLALAVAPTGHAAVAWGGGGIGALASVWNGQEWSPPEPLSDPQPDIIVGELRLRLSGGTGAAVWTESGTRAGLVPTRVRARVWKAEEGWGPQVELGRDVGSPFPIARPAVDSQERVTLLWGERQAHYIGPSVVHAIRYERSTGWQPPQAMGEHDDIVGLEAHDGGQLTAILRGRKTDRVSPVEAMRYVEGAGWRDLSSSVIAKTVDDESVPYASQAANSPTTTFVDPDGSLWLARPGDPWVIERVPFEAAADSSCGTLSPNPRRPGVATDASGATVVVWTSHDCRGTSVVVWRRPGPAL